MTDLDRVLIQSDDFDVAEQYKWLQADESSPGAIVTFTGLVRDYASNQQITALYIEHYPAMTEKSLRGIIVEARQRWRLQKVAVIHRVGQLAARQQIVFVGISSAHRLDAFEAGQFIMDYLKVQAPFWKKEVAENGEYWVAAKDSDQQAAGKWQL